jgi:hypothetical protein
MMALKRHHAVLRAFRKQSHLSFATNYYEIASPHASSSLSASGSQ